MMILKYLRTVGAAALLTTAMALPAVAQSAKAVLQDKSGKEVGTVDLLQTPAGVLLKLALKGVPAGEHAFHLHAVGKCDPPAFDSAGPHFNPTNEKHGMLSGHGHAGAHADGLAGARVHDRVRLYVLGNFPSELERVPFLIGRRPLGELVEE